MNKHKINYGYGIADFWTEATDPKQIEDEFYELANCCFGIRKSLAGYSLEQTYENVELPLPYRNQEATNLLSHHGDDILFDRRYKCPDGTPWKLHNEHGDWCSCKERGKPELSCEVHHFWVENHDEICSCLNNDKGDK